MHGVLQRKAIRQLPVLRQHGGLLPIHAVKLAVDHAAERLAAALLVAVLGVVGRDHGVALGLGFGGIFFAGADVLQLFVDGVFVGAPALRCHLDLGRRRCRLVARHQRCGDIFLGPRHLAVKRSVELFAGALLIQLGNLVALGLSLGAGQRVIDAFFVGAPAENTAVHGPV